MSEWVHVWAGECMYLRIMYMREWVHVFAGGCMYMSEWVHVWASECKYMSKWVHVWAGECMYLRASACIWASDYGVATCSRLLKIIGLLCKRALWKRRYSAKETYNFKEPTNRSHPIHVFASGCIYCEWVHVYARVSARIWARECMYKRVSACIRTSECMYESKLACLFYRYQSVPMGLF